MKAIARIQHEFKSDRKLLNDVKKDLAYSYVNNMTLKDINKLFKFTNAKSDANYFYIVCELK